MPLLSEQRQTDTHIITLALAWLLGAYFGHFYSQGGHDQARQDLHETGGVRETGLLALMYRIPINAIHGNAHWTGNTQQPSESLICTMLAA